jgi:hypothetical protein
VANDQVYTVVDMYYKDLWDMERTLKELTYYDVNDQICIVNQALIDEHLRFAHWHEVSL